MSVFIVINGPTGIGKTTQMQRVIDTRPDLCTAVRSVTTRARRGPDDDIWYRFVTREEKGRFDPDDVVSDVEFRGESYVLLRSEIDAALQRAPVAFMAVMTPVIAMLRERGIPLVLLRMRVADRAAYADRLQRRGYDGIALEREIENGLAFAYAPDDPSGVSADVWLGSDTEDDARVDAALERLVPDLFGSMRA